MKLTLGLCLVVLGLVLLVLGVNASESFAADASRVFAGNSTGRAMWLLLGGVPAVIVGLVVSATNPRVLKKR